MVLNTGILSSDGIFVSSLTITDDIKVLTPNGTFKAYGDLVGGDEAVTEDGVNTTVKFVVPEM